MSRLIFWDVDTLYDFMRADGKLYVPGSEEIIPVAPVADRVRARPSGPDRGVGRQSRGG